MIKAEELDLAVCRDYSKEVTGCSLPLSPLPVCKKAKAELNPPPFCLTRVYHKQLS